MRDTARDKLIAAAETLLLSRGYAATTVDEICAAAGVSKGSFYHFFATKEELALAVLDAFTARNGKLVAQGLRPGGDPVKRSLALLDHLLGAAGKLWGSGCLLGSFALDLADTNPAIREAVSRKFREVASLVADGLKPLAAEGGNPGAPRAAELAEHFIVTVEGALILARAHQDWSYVDRALDRFRRDVRKAIGQPD